MQNKFTKNITETMDKMGEEERKKKSVVTKPEGFALSLPLSCPIQFIHSFFVHPSFPYVNN